MGNPDNSPLRTGKSWGREMGELRCLAEGIILITTEAGRAKRLNNPLYAPFSDQIRVIKPNQGMKHTRIFINELHNLEHSAAKAVRALLEAMKDG